MTAVRAVVAHALREAAAFNADSSVRPAAVFWSDPDRAWEPVIRLLQEAVPILILGEYDLDKAQGPAIWMRAVLADPDSAELPDHLASHDEKNPWVIYLPGIGRSALSEANSPESAIAPLVEIALRSNWWPSAYGQGAWTPHSFLGSKHGVGFDLGGDAKSKAALSDVLDRLLIEKVDDLRLLGRLDASRLHSLVMTDSIRMLLDWLDDPEASRAALSAASWNAFREACRATYGIDPEKDGVLTAAARLGGRQGAWQGVWDRFEDNPRRYENIPIRLDQARPAQDLFGDVSPHPDSWPSWNAEQESELRQALTAVATTMDLEQARATVVDLAAGHSPREESVWGEMGRAPLAQAVALLSELAELTRVSAPGNGLEAQIKWYVELGHKIDDLALRSLAAVPGAADRASVRKALQVLYDPWVDRTARAFQDASSGEYSGDVGLNVAAGTCVVFVDALRFDLAQRLAKRLAPLEIETTSRLAAFPTVTPTGQPAVAPVNTTFGAGPAFDAGDAQGRSVKAAIFRSALTEAGVQYLDWKSSETGDISGVGWTQTNTIDALGHDHGHELAGMIDQQLDLVAERIRSLLDAGWQRVVVVTDHGFLLPATAAPKVDLPLAITEGDAARKPRVARLKTGVSSPDLPVLAWTWDAAINMVSAPGASAFVAGTLYEHGGLSPQECVTPVLEIKSGGGAPKPAQIDSIRWTGQRCRIDYAPVEADVTAEVRLAPGDPGSIIGGPKAPGEPGEIKVLVDEERAAAGTQAFVLLLGVDGTVLAQRETKVGGVE